MDGEQCSGKQFLVRGLLIQEQSDKVSLKSKLTQGSDSCQTSHTAFHTC